MSMLAMHRARQTAGRCVDCSVEDGARGGAVHANETLTGMTSKVTAASAVKRAVLRLV